MKAIIDVGRRSVTRLITDAHVDGVYNFHTEYLNDDLHDRNQRIRLEGLMQRGQRLPLMDGAEATHCFSIPVDEWALLKRDYPDLVSGLESKDIEENNKAAERLRILKPHWYTMAGNR